MKKLEKRQGGEKMEGKDFLIAAILLIGVFLAGYLISPEYISLEDMERTGFETQIVDMQTNHTNIISGWNQYADECNNYQETIRAEEEIECSLEKSEMVDRLSQNNYDLIEINDDWQDLVEDINESVHDLNNTITDLNCWR